MKPLSLGIVCFPSLGGSGVVASAQAVGLAHRGHRIHLVSTASPARPLPVCERLTFHRVEVPDYPLFEHPPYTLALASQLADLSRAHRWDILHVHYAVPHAASAYLARQILGKDAPKVVTSLHGTDVMRVGAHPAYRTATAFTVAQSDGVVVPSAFLKREAQRLIALPSHLRIEIIPNFVDAQKFSPAEGFGVGREGPVLFHVSNFRPVKRVTDTIEVLARVRKSLPARLVLVGDGPGHPEAEERARRLGLSEVVRFSGRRDDFVSELKQADAFLLPSEVESFGVAALEALSCGVPVFGYRAGGLPELVTENVGRLVAPFDVDALAAAVTDVLSDAEEHKRLSQAARKHVLENFQTEPALNRYETYLRAIG